MHKFVPFITFLLGMSSSYSYDLRDVFHIAQKSDPIYLAAKATMESTAQSVPQAAANFLPIVSAAFSTTGNTSTISTLNRYNTNSISLSVSQEIFNPIYYENYAKASDATKAAISTYNSAGSELILRVAGQYFAILKAKDDLDFAEAEKKSFARLLEQTRERFKVGLIAITDVHEARAKYDSANAQEILANNELKDQIEIMEQITGKALTSFHVLKKNITLKRPEPSNINHWVNTASTHNHELLASVSTRSSAKRNIGVNSSSHLPTLSVSADIAYAKGLPPTSSYSTSSSATLTLSVPIFNGGGTYSKTREAMHDYEIAYQQTIETKRRVISETKQAYRGIISKVSEIQALKQAVTSSESALSATESAFQVGTRTIVDVLNAQSDILNAKKNYRKARYDYLIETLKLKQAAGILTKYDLYTVNEMLS